MIDLLHPLTVDQFTEDAWQRDLTWYCRSIIDGTTGSPIPDVELRLLVGPAAVWLPAEQRDHERTRPLPPPYAIALYHKIDKQSRVLWSGTRLDEAIHVYNEGVDSEWAKAWVEALRREPL